MKIMERVIITENGEECRLSDNFEGFKVSVIDPETPDGGAALYALFNDGFPVLLAMYRNKETAEQMKMTLEGDTTSSVFYMPFYPGKAAEKAGGAFNLAFDHRRQRCNGAPGWDGASVACHGIDSINGNNLNCFYYANFFNYGAMCIYKALVDNGYMEKSKQIEDILATGFNEIYFYPDWNGTL